MNTEISESIENLKREKKIIARKVLEFTQAFKNTIAKMEKKYEERFACYEAKLLELESEKFENLESRVCRCEVEMKNATSIVEKCADGVSKLEQEVDNTNELIKKIDKNLAELDAKIIDSTNIIEKLKKSSISETKDEEVKQCIFDRTGFCREKDQCMFLHTDEVCEIFLGNQICWKKKCIKRHPKVCRYFKRGVCRRDGCRYLHYDVVQDNIAKSACDRCEKVHHQSYFCEFCCKKFCANCTVEEAHVANIYENKKENPSCSDIHL